MCNLNGKYFLQLMQSDSGHHHSFRQFEAGNADNGVWFNENANKKHPESMREKRGFPADFEHQRNQFRADFQEAKLENEEQVDSFHKWIIPIAIVGILLLIFVPMCIGICVLLVLRKKN
jgi:hypothetical protein